MRPVRLATIRGLDVLREGLAEADRPIADAAGLVRFERTFKTDIRIVRLPSGKDPDELIRKDVAAWSTPSNRRSHSSISTLTS